MCVSKRWVRWLVDTDNLFFSTHILSCLDSQLREDLLALRQNFSNLTVSTEDQVKALSTQGEGDWVWGLGLGEGWWGCQDFEQVYPLGSSVGRKMKLVESKLEKQQKDLTEDHSSLLLHVKQLVSDVRSLSCQMAAFRGNGEGWGY